jgi:4-hydroxy-2-oxoheptanedioate aldolase
MDIPRLNGIIRQFEKGETAFVAFTPAENFSVQAIGGAPFDGIVFELEHNPYDISKLRDGLQYLLDRRQIAKSGSLAPAVTPMVRVPVNGSEMNQWIAKQVLDSGVYGIVWPHISTVEEARNAVAACRYPRPTSSPTYHPPGLRGDSPKAAAKYWGLSNEEYYARADVWPIDPKGEIFVCIMCEDMVGVKNLRQILKEVPGIGAVMIGEGDLSQDLGLPRQYDHPTVTEAVDEVLAICNEANVPCGLPHATAKRAAGLIERGFRMLIASPERSFAALDAARKAAGRT